MHRLSKMSSRRAAIGEELLGESLPIHGLLVLHGRMDDELAGWKRLLATAEELHCSLELICSPRASLLADYREVCSFGGGSAARETEPLPA
ncbi:hypothetical protein Dimus_016445 [Dionaea muscipula]